MNQWFERFLAEGGVELDPLTREEATRLLDLAGAAARSSGARQFAPLATYLAGRAATAATPPERLALIERLVAAATAAGEAEQPLDV